MTKKGKPVKLIIQIPCYNEEHTLGITLSALPKKLEGIDIVEWLVIDDGSEDSTFDIARHFGVDHIIRLSSHQGLAKAFQAGLEASLKNGADIIVNMDADNQYPAEYIPQLIKPIILGEAKVVVGARPISDSKLFSPVKKLLHKFGGFVVRWISGTTITDVTSGFRAISREAALRIHVFDDYTYTIETVIQAGWKKIPIISFPININKTSRPSRLIRNTPFYVIRSILTIISYFIIYKPLRFFAIPGILVVLGGCLLGLRFLYFYLQNNDHSFQAFIESVLMIGAGFFLFIFGLIGHLISANRALLEDLTFQLRQIGKNRKV